MGESGEHETAEPPADRGAPDDDHARLAAIVDAWAAAIVSNDAARIADFMADEWVIVSESGITEREAFLAYVESGDLTHSAMRAVTPPRIRIHGDTATVTVRITNTAHYGGRRFDADEWTTDVFVRRDGGWRCVLSHITPVATPADPPPDA
ncbi:nuclear transport factor 2 family protein [Streptomyces durocortorensis]|uniref:Nuclear transport factor 2 family protein n=1 Tax=Streptomyces durocortorensis TaxID=2811104 RepID=A0ABS2I1A0_9ACTN|nr:nuclear transport factor 2 family protein [Streptomyces durocortorensis]MBM7057009.1 nuclear transport factor 2 family protein [Streptomyces durocortorensis]